MTLLEEARAAIPFSDTPELIERLVDELERSHTEEMRLSVEVLLCRRRLGDLLAIEENK